MAIVKITRNNFKQEVTRSDLPVLLDFYAPWCLPSKIADFVLKSVNNQFHDNIKIGKIDIQSQPYLAKMFEIKNTYKVQFG